MGVSAELFCHVDCSALLHLMLLYQSTFERFQACRCRIVLYCRSCSAGCVTCAASHVQHHMCTVTSLACVCRQLPQLSHKVPCTAQPACHREDKENVYTVRRFNHASRGRPWIDQRHPIPLKEGPFVTLAQALCVRGASQQQSLAHKQFGALLEVLPYVSYMATIV